MLRRVAVTVLAIIAVITFSAAQPQSASSPDAEVLRFMQDLVRMDTSNGNETKAARYIQAVFEKEGIPSVIFESAPGRGNIVARLKGNGTKKPVLLMAHTDVVGVDRTKWTVDPFAAIVKDGYLYGRGSDDDKSLVAAHMEILLQLKRENVKLDRDVIFLAEAGEEGTPQFGIKYMIENHWDKIDCEYAVSEGGTTLVKDGRVVYVAIATTEKNPRVIRLVAHGSAGHGSIPRLDNPIEHLGAAVGKLLDWQPPMKLNDTTRVFFSQIEKVSDDPQLKRAAAYLGSPETQRFLAQKYPEYYSMLRTSVVPTVFQSGFRRNVIPAEAEATLDTRTVPDENFDSLLQELRKLINDPLVEVLPTPQYRGISAPSKIDNDMFQALVAAQQKLYPQAFTLPQMVTVATDLSELRAKGVQAYGINTPQLPEDQATMHGNDERVHLGRVNDYVRYLRIAVEQVAASH